MLAFKQLFERENHKKSTAVTMATGLWEHDDQTFLYTPT